MAEGRKKMKWFFVEYGDDFYDEFSRQARDEAEAEKIYEEKSKLFKFCKIVVFEAGA